MSQPPNRSVEEDPNRRIAIEATRNGGSAQVQDQYKPLAALKARCSMPKRSMVDVLLDAGSVDGPDFELPAREVADDSFCFPDV